MCTVEKVGLEKCYVAFLLNRGSLGVPATRTAPGQKP